MASTSQRYFDSDRMLDDVLFPTEDGVDAQFVDSLLASLQVPGSSQYPAPGMPPVGDPGQDHEAGSAHSAHDRGGLEKEASGGSSGSERGQHHEAHGATPSLKVREKNKRAQVRAYASMLNWLCNPPVHRLSLPEW